MQLNPASSRMFFDCASAAEGKQVAMEPMVDEGTVEFLISSPPQRTFCLRLCVWGSRALRRLSSDAVAPTQKDRCL